MSYHDAPEWSWEEQPHVEPYPFTPTTDNDSLLASLQAIPDCEDAEAWFEVFCIDERQYRAEEALYYMQTNDMHEEFRRLMNWHQVADETRVPEVAR